MQNIEKLTEITKDPSVKPKLKKILKEDILFSIFNFELGKNYRDNILKYMKSIIYK